MGRMRMEIMHGEKFKFVHNVSVQLMINLKSISERNILQGLPCLAPVLLC